MLDFNQEKLSIKYSGNVPHDYDISLVQVTFDFIYSVLKNETTIDNAVKDISKRYALSEEYLFDYFLENKFIIDKTNKNDFFELLKNYNTKSLKRMLKEHGLKTSGKR